MQKYEKVLDLMRNRPNGRIELTDPELNELLDRSTKDKQSLMYRIATYMSFIRRYKNLQVRGIRNGRKVVAYELVALADAQAPAEQGAADANTSVGATA